MNAPTFDPATPGGQPMTAQSNPVAVGSQGPAAATPSAQAVALHIEQLHVAYEAPGARHTVVQNFSLHVPAGQTACLLGPSGCGKTTVLRAVAGFEPVQAGQIRLGDELLSAPGIHVPPERRRMGMVFQDHALFPHLSAAQNVAFGLHHLPRAQRAERVAQMLQLVGLADLGDRYPHQLSGGQQQRIALARALAPSPKLLLLDEPFSSLDSATSEHLLSEMRSILHRTGQTALLVTHNLHEARTLADEVFVMSADGVQRQHLKDACAQSEGCGKVVPVAE
ncbi:MAG: ABC transporter ATP-binding protein [Brachymonas sp.]|nr:ABC transporter ATP-binding protein [Brachymonas sp.]